MATTTTTASSSSRDRSASSARSATVVLEHLGCYLFCGLLHELAHLAAARCFLPGFVSPAASFDGVLRWTFRAFFGRCCALDSSAEEGFDDDVPSARIAAVRHAGWIFSVFFALILHWFFHNKRPGRGRDGEKSSEPTRTSSLIVAAYATALEAAVTDLLGWNPGGFGSTSSTRLLFFCGNFGTILLNPSWINVDGGKTALDMLEKMVEVTMMRGAQSGGVVTFEPASPSSGPTGPSAPVLRGVRSRVVNAKRTVLSRGVRSKIERDNCPRNLIAAGLGGKKKLRGWDERAFNPPPSSGGGGGSARIVRGFFGHTRFATSSMASMDGTHPHQWSPPRSYEFYPFQSAKAAGRGTDSGMDGSRRRATGTGLDNVQRAVEEGKVIKWKPKSQGMRVENYVTHNGDFEFYRIHGKYHDTEAVQSFLEKALGIPMPAVVDSAAIAGVVDLLRVQGCFALSARYAVCFQIDDKDASSSPWDPNVVYPTTEQYEAIGEVFASELDALVREDDVTSLEALSASEVLREVLARRVRTALVAGADAKGGGRGTPALRSALAALASFVPVHDDDDEEGGRGGSLGRFARATVDAFLDNDLLHACRIFLEGAKGSFGLCVSTSMDAHRQVVFAAKGQTLSVAFYPRKGVICYGSEQAAVKAGLNYETPQGPSSFGTDFKHIDEDAVRLDLDDLGGEICLLDWGYGGDNEPAVSVPNRNLAVNKLMGGAVSVVLLHQENVMDKSAKLHKRLVKLENNEFIKPLLDDCDDPVLSDIQDIPRIVSNIQEDWQDVGLNRMTAWHLGQCIRQRMQAHVDGSVENHASQVDILVTGCEVSLWISEQFVADLAKCFPKLYVKAVSSNKLLGLFGQELSMPSIGFPFTPKTLDMKDPIVIIVSHSGGTFGPLACSNLLQSFSSSIFTVTSEWDTQIGKQLRSMYGDKNDLLTSRIFSTDVGVRPAEPCSISVVATHQLLTNIFEHICVTIIGNPHFRAITGAIITERDLQTLERCNRENVKSLERIVGVDRRGDEVHELMKKTERELRAAGDVWSEHILENAKAYIMSFVYIVVTVTIGFPLISGISYAAGLREDSSPGDRLFYLLRFFDALVYFWLPQINIFILRLIQGRNLRHRMVGRTCVIGDPCPWVAQSAEAFLGKIFACSYSIAGLNVLSGNPADHLVHRHTHRVVRGSLLVCGRPDGRLTALTTLEASTCLAVNQASSIQSIGGTCESLTIGHNMSKLPLSYRGIFLESHRPQFLCERLLEETDQQDAVKSKAMQLTAAGNLKAGPTSFVASDQNSQQSSQEEAPAERPSVTNSISSRFSTSGSSKRHFSIRNLQNQGRPSQDDDLNQSLRKRILGSVKRTNSTIADDQLNTSKHRSSASLLGAYSNMEKDAKKKASKQGVRDTHDIDTVISDMIKEKQGEGRFAEIFRSIDVNGDGSLDFEEFTEAYQKINSDVSMVQLEAMFQEADLDGNGTLDLDEFIALAKMPQVDVLGKLGVSNRDDRGLVQVMPSTERYFGEELRSTAPKGTGAFVMSQSQHLAMELYESRIASMQRFVAMTVMFHQMGMRVESFFPRISFGLLGYRMDRTHSIMRIATTASPVSGADVRDRMVELHLRFKIQKAVNIVARKYLVWKKEQARRQSQASWGSSINMPDGEVHDVMAKLA